MDCGSDMEGVTQDVETTPLFLTGPVVLCVSQVLLSVLPPYVMSAVFSLFHRAVLSSLLVILEAASRNLTDPPPTVSGLPVPPFCTPSDSKKAPFSAEEILPEESPSFPASTLYAWVALAIMA